MPITTLPSRLAQRRFPCTQCNLSFTRNASLKRHWNEAHVAQSMKPIHPCFHCMKSFPRPDTLSRHIAEKHLGDRKKVACDRCGKLVHRRYLAEHWNTSACHRIQEATSEWNISKEVAEEDGFSSGTSAMDSFWSNADILVTNVNHRDLLRMSPDYAAYHLMIMNSYSIKENNPLKAQNALGLTYAVVRHACNSLTTPFATATLRLNILIAITTLLAVESRLEAQEAVAIHRRARDEILRGPLPKTLPSLTLDKMSFILNWARICDGTKAYNAILDLTPLAILGMLQPSLDQFVRLLKQTDSPNRFFYVVGTDEE